MNSLLAMPVRYFGIYVLTMLCVSALALSKWTVLYAALFIVILTLATRQARIPTWRQLALLCASLAIGMNIAYLSMADAIPAVRDIRLDTRLLAIDQWLMGQTPAVSLQRITVPWLTEFCSICYIGFMPLLFIHLLRYFFNRRDLLGEFYAGLFTVYGVGFLGYLLVPAAGPWIAFPQLFSQPLTGGIFTDICTSMVIKGSNRVDVWPSLHCAASLYMLGFSWHHHRQQFYGLLLPILGLCFSTLYLRYHYFVDVVCGMLLATVALFESSRYASLQQSVCINPEETSYDVVR